MEKQLTNNTFKRSFRIFLQEELSSRCANNPNYSLRAFAKAIDVSPSSLSAILNNKRPITEKMKQKIAIALGMELNDLSIFNSHEHGNKKHKTMISDSSQVDYEQISSDTFSIISKWHHYAIMEMIKLNSFKRDANWISSRLGISKNEATLSVERLLRVGLLEEDEFGNLIDTTNGFSTDIRDGLTSIAQKTFQKQTLKKALEAIDNVELEKRDNTSIMMAINTEDLPKAKKFLANFRRNFCQEMELNDAPNEVYQLNLSFYPLTKGKEL